ncbi:DoxX family membrane protein [Archangium primigenium]|uniref:DoxX family protein n=1 Tax=[Archangium] primigenium TaxID=2792470 RepID=UPI00195D5012|nr:DoxX family membrane protein [Archangium primigenium]MBM7115087.1 DoxX family membrane protein [Archangium primigenium]
MLRDITNTPPTTTPLQNAGRWLLGTFMTGAGTGHLSFARESFQAQVPDWLPMDKDTVVLLSGVVEIGLGLALLLGKRHRALMGLGLAAFFAAVFPGNLHQYDQRISAFGLNTDTRRLVRLFFQPVLMGWAMWSTGAFKALRRT